MNSDAPIIQAGNMQFLLIVAFAFVAGIQLYYYIRYFFPLTQHVNSDNATQSSAVSIVISAKNEQETIEKCVQQLLNQNYPSFEIIVVNDYSEDDTWTILKKLESEQVVLVNNTQQQGKKSALSQGIERAKNECLLFTDADCMPNSKFWISNMVCHLSDEKEVVLGFGAFRKEKGLLNKLIRFEGFMTGVQCFGFAKSGKAYMGVGRNLMYKKSVFTRVGGFQEHQSTLSGDDDLLVNTVATATNVAIEMEEESHTISDAEKSWKRFILQKRRQLTAGVQYKKSDQLRLAIYGATNFLYYGLFLILLVVSPFTVLILGIFVVKQLLEFLLFREIAQRLREGDLMPFISFLEPLYIFSLTAIGISTWFWKVKQWK
jgi:hypothetical protein